jgi:hypothetical protein
MPVALRCLLGDDVLNRALHDHPDSTLQASLSQDDVPGVAEHRWRKRDHAGLWPVWTLTGTETGYEFDLTFLVAKEGVRVFWKRGTFVEP